MATGAALPSGDPDDRHLTDALTRAGIDYSWIEWNSADPKDLTDSIDMLILRSPWDYPEHHERFLSWLDAIEIPVYNSPGVVRWNSNKRYLLDLADAGVPTVPTRIIDTIEQLDGDATLLQVKDDFAEFVVKPAIGVGSMGARRFAATDVDAARSHAASLIGSGRPSMVQPYLPSVDAGSETALIHFGGVFSHSITKGPMLTSDGERPLVDGLYVQENIDPRQASDLQREVALQALAAVPGGPPLYARVDLIDDLDGAPIVLELELIEPSLFFAFEPQGPDRFVEAIHARF
ncbi:MAG: ATP-grasp domain-containing protein [Candidatus Nanopelagicales bacterium]